MSKRRRREPPRPPPADVRAYLVDQPREALIELVLEHAEKDRRLHDRLVLAVAKGRLDSRDLASFRDMLDEAIRVHDYVPWREAYGYAQGVHEAIDAVEKLVDDRPETVIELAEYALAASEDAIQRVDDSDGEFGGIFERLQDVHHKACVAARPDPATLAKRLFAWEMRTEWDTFDGAVQTYADVLGPYGLETYRRLAAERWMRVRPTPPGAKDAERYDGHFRITRIMLALARQSGRLSDEIDVHARDLSSAYDFLEIAELCRERGRDDLALEWAQRGVEAFGPTCDERLREFLADEHTKRAEHADALELAWGVFAHRADLGRYQALRRHATAAGAWKQWRERAIAHVRASIATAAGKPPDKWGIGAHRDHSELVRIFMFEQDVEAAWREARAGGCSDDLWLDLASRRRDEYPAEVLEVLLQQVDRSLQVTHQHAYEEAVGLMKSARELFEALGVPQDFHGYVRQIREKHKRRRNLLKLIDRQGWTPPS